MTITILRPDNSREVINLAPPVTIIISGLPQGTAYCFSDPREVLAKKEGA